MNNLEFSNGFDTLLNSYLNPNAIVLSEYEKSFFLTEALNQFVKEMYQSTSGAVSYECDEKTRRELDTLVQTVKYDKLKSAHSDKKLSSGKYIHNVFVLPEDCWYIVYEEVDLSDAKDCKGLHIADVVPVTHDDYFRTVLNPFRGPTETRVLRLDKGGREVEIISTTNNYVYTVRYIKQPEPIVLQTLPGDASIEEEMLTENPCKLPSGVHWTILTIAVLLAVLREGMYNKK